MSDIELVPSGVDDNELTLLRVDEVSAMLSATGWLCDPDEEDVPCAGLAAGGDPGRVVDVAP